ncbi:M48 family metalloprotease [Flectobacillus sp. DC10W]|jgi:Zn-dependent protease with chaperone function|uniref:M48 family metalloprotease n=1 Tax=Flectobacillus longus TaxID=2984207 RepID=A0ABT6YUD4_9BACT|nr:M48 family metallopeptidase [Flectobacillus longus]MDI9867217.1 M48 family metalloprotease [Flectobacillus longus]
MPTIIAPPSKTFKDAAIAATISIIVFIGIYILLLILALGLTAILGVAGLSFMILMVSRIHIWGAFIGIGLMSIGVVVLIFLIKFIFIRNTTNLDRYTEITRNEQPQLFALLDEIVQKVGTSFPKKVYLSAEVNASVFYDSSFLSMFLPIKKNLQIGLGLMNSLTQDELKAVLAHEFGHFSQKSMKIGSYVYYTNQVIQNLLFQNDAFGSLLDQWANIHWFIKLGVRVAIYIIIGIQKVLQFFYKLINVNYLKLSREMEFHADAIAAHVAGSEALANALLRIDLANSAYYTVLNFYEKNISKAKITNNIYPQQSWIMKSIAEINDVPLNRDLPQVTLEKFDKIIQSKLIIEDQWATHPSMTERVQHLQKLNIPIQQTHQDLAINLLQNPQSILQHQTEQLFAMVQYDRITEIVSYEQFVEIIQEEKKHNSYAPEYKGYFDWRHPAPIEESLKNANIDQESLFSPEIFEKLEEITILNNDITKLQQLIILPELPDFIEYDNKRVPQTEINNLLEQLQDAMETGTKALFEHEQMVSALSFQHATAKGQGQQYETELLLLLETQQLHEQNYELVQKIYGALQFAQVNTPFKEISRHFEEFLSIEKYLKVALQNLLEVERWQAYWEEEDRVSCQTFIEGTFVYFTNPEYDRKALDILFSAIQIFEKMEWKVFFEDKSAFLKGQLPWLEKVLK